MIERIIEEPITQQQSGKEMASNQQCWIARIKSGHKKQKVRITK